MALANCLRVLCVIVILSNIAAQQPKIVLLVDSDVDQTLVDDAASLVATWSQQSFNVTMETVLVDALDNFQFYHEVCRLVDDGAVVIINTVCVSTPGLPAFTFNLQVSLVQINTGCTQVFTDDGYDVLHLPYPSPHVSVPVSAVLTEMGWTDIIFLYDDTQDHTSVEAMFSVFGTINTRFQSIKLSTSSLVTDIQSVLHQAASYSQPRFVVMCCHDCVRELLQQMNDYDSSADSQALFTFAARLLVVGDVTLEPYLLSRLDHVLNVVLISPNAELVNSTSYYTQTAVSHIMSSLQLISSQYNASDLLSYNTTTVCSSRRLDLTSYLSAELHVNQITSSPRENSSQYDVFTAHAWTGQIRHLELVAEWREDQRFVKQSDLMPNINYGLNNMQLRVGFFEEKPFITRNVTSEYGYDGMCIELLMELARNLNFSFVLIKSTEPVGEKYGPNASWTGALGQLRNKEVDLVIAPIAKDYHREHYIDFTQPYFTEYNTVMMRYDNPDAYKWYLYLSPFQWQVWLVLIAMVPTGGMVLWLLSRYSPSREEGEKYKGLELPQHSFLYTYGAVLSQGGIYLPTAQSGRFFVGFYWMACIGIVATFSGNLIAFLTVTKTELPLTSLEQLANQDSYLFGYKGGSFLESSLQITTDPLLRQINSKINQFKAKDPSITSTNNTYQVHRALDTKYAYLDTQTTFEIVMSEHCDISVFKEEIFPLEYAVALQNNSAFLQLFDDEIINIRTTGLVNKWKAKWWPRQNFCTNGVVTASQPVSIADVQGAFYVMGTLLTVAVTTFFVEHILWKNKEMKKKKMRSITVASRH